MVFCDKISVNSEYAVYKFGSSPDHVSGIVFFYKQDPRFIVEKHPEEKAMPLELLARIWLKYKESIKKGDFPEKMCIQIG